MAIVDMAALKAKLEAKENNSKPRQGGDNSFFPFFNSPENTTTTIRFLPDGDTTNDFFWVEKLHINLTFNGIKGQSNDPVTVRVPCMEMYGKPDPILSQTRSWWKDPALEETARKYWKKKSYLFQGFVIDSPFTEDNAPENPIRRFSISPGIFDKVRAAIIDMDFEDNPTDYVGGRNFRLKVTKKGNFRNYDTSSWSPKVEPLNSAQLEAIDKYGLVNLSSLLPTEPTAEEVEMISEMFKDSVDEKAFDSARFGNSFRPFGSGARATTNTVSPSTPSAALPSQDEEPTTGGQDIAAILARVNASRQK